MRCQPMAALLAAFVLVIPMASTASTYLGAHKLNGKKALPESVDWTAKGAVTPVKNQGQCGSDWSFSATGALEGAWQIATGELLSLSEQQLVSCPQGSNGCNGGAVNQVFESWQTNGSCTESLYPYKAEAGQCEAAKCTAGIPFGSVTGYYDVSTDDMHALMDAVRKQPVSVGIDGDVTAFQNYESGVLSLPCDGNNFDDRVLLVGYGTDEKEKKDYWNVKNSWGGSWGEKGYVRIERSSTKTEGVCGIGGQAYYPKVKGRKV